MQGCFTIIYDLNISIVVCILVFFSQDKIEISHTQIAKFVHLALVVLLLRQLMKSKKYVPVYMLFFSYRELK